jgi:hypothetical protein
MESYLMIKLKIVEKKINKVDVVIIITNMIMDQRKVNKKRKKIEWKKKVIKEMISSSELMDE